MAGVAYNNAPLYGPTAPNEELYHIAGSVRPNFSVSIPQVMVAILNLNPQAFSQNNVNGLKAGYTLRIPPLNMIYRIQPDYAQRFVTHQNTVWHKINFAENAKSHPKLAKNQDSEKSSRKVLATAKKDVGNLQKTTKVATATEPTTTVTPPKSSIVEIASQQEQIKAQPNPTHPTQTTNQGLPEQIPTALNHPTLNPAQTASLNNATNNLANLMQDTQNFKQQTTTRLNNIEKQQKNIEDKINQLDDEFKTLTYHFIQYANKNQKSNNNYWQQLQENFKSYSTNLIIAFLVFFILLLLLLRSFKSKTRLKPAAPKTGETKKDEYDYMNSEESIPTKLDLARAYMEMGDNESAKSALSEVAVRGNEGQKREANSLLDKLNSLCE